MDSTVLANVRILLAEDALDLRRFFVHVLELSGADVIGVASAEEALAAFRESPPDLLISDIGLPDADGVTLIGRIRALPPSAGGNVPAIALTGVTEPVLVKAILEGGFSTYLAKPVHFAQLVEASATLIRSRTASRMPSSPETSSYWAES